MFLRFEEWLFDQQYRDDLIGDLARVLSMQNIDRKPSKHKSDEHKNWVETGKAIYRRHPELIRFLKNAVPKSAFPHASRPC